MNSDRTKIKEKNLKGLKKSERKGFVCTTFKEAYRREQDHLAAGHTWYQNDMQCVYGSSPNSSSDITICNVYILRIAHVDQDGTESRHATEFTTSPF